MQASKREDPTWGNHAKAILDVIFMTKPFLSLDHPLMLNSKEMD
jgi:hypothetical protein